ncbi:MAG TPA: nicotinate-nucleotide--dimethylbenzimidazole phosphoribosyltransferase [Ilumatobacter sp.]|jgi:nicotinate-nucleotide--dimethylbenzimidazole phosphoribosyltransferase|nr:nicotinate-nucleotide--dimethylbenzimidazole phosphoribosyltransferase [Ilumatobacter sp.]
MSWLHDALRRLPGPDSDAAGSVRARADDILRPRGALARLDDVAVHMAAWQRTAAPRVARPAALVFAGDHGVAEQGGVSAYPTEVTAAMLAACRQGKATICALARSVGATLDTVDVGVGRPTADIRYEAAMTAERFDAVVAEAVAAVDALDTDLLVLGEIGIGNTTAAAALAGALLGGDASTWVGRGTGIDDDGLDRKRAAVAAVMERSSGLSDPIEIMRHAGGAELTAMAAATVAARLRSIAVVLDGYVVTSAVLPLHVAAPGALDHCIVGHCSSEPGHRRVLERIGKPVLLDLGMRLGEGSGAMVAVPIVRAACDAVVEVATFTEWFGRRPG